MTKLIQMKMLFNVLGSQKRSCLFPKVAKARLAKFDDEAGREQQ